MKSPLLTNNSLALPLVCQLSGYCPVGAAFAQFHRETRLSPATRAPHPAFHSSQHSAAIPQPCSRILSSGPTSARARPTCPQMTNSFRFSTTACPASHAPGNKCDLGTRRPALDDSPKRTLESRLRPPLRGFPSRTPKARKARSKGRRSALPPHSLAGQHLAGVAESTRLREGQRACVSPRAPKPWGPPRGAEQPGGHLHP